jgi:hypothetical protein
MVYDVVRRRIVLIGGQTASEVTNTVWDYDGTTWTPVVTADVLTKRSLHAAVYDHVQGRAVVFGGTSAGTAVGDTWSLGFSTVNARETCQSGVDYDLDAASGCADDECWGICAPLCGPGAAGACTTSPRCGDGACTGLESCRNCSADCGVGTSPCPIRCGDFICDGPTETSTTCPGDCP